MSDCVPYALHILSGKPFSEVMEAVSTLPAHCRWSVEGMSMLTAWAVLQGWGIQVGKFTVPSKRITLSHFVAHACSGCDYMVGLRGHVLSIKDGAVFDKAQTPGQSMVQAYIEVFKGDNSHG